ncbi:MAG: protein translocase subunit SecF [Sedimenticola sp.]|uniref:Protein-export membrane protein SecF n=1 Tax=Sedimenticola thiotaurini TaxID=1543721 RepID=A0A558D8J3_9GAMM|nr:protein translocase subunit SecF [Sedimenticola sp.]TVT57354.1 MAG: protein translocase subunit SecF [Sedimenticola thiotaurini]MCW8883068.1 protein translocase subunit SecF [Sedimenticola sp.]MCW8919935.1 protein translocase subunit SecF [Sedimenticola sp.]MCW8950551.1 protein translocase subunit SecF [Sedimenticola sp.]
MQIFKKNTHIDFMGKRKLAMYFSILLMLISLGAIVLRGLSLGIDFTGGTLIEVGYQEAAELSKVREVLQSGGFGDATVQHFGTSKDVLVRLSPQAELQGAQLSDRAFAALKQADAGEATLRRVEFVGPQVGDDLTEDGGLAVLYALIGILAYVALRFEYRFALGSVIALIHDVLITIGIFSLFQIEFDLTVLAAVLAVIGYSLNDTIVVFDRIRENFRKMRKGGAAEIINSSLNQTLSRTLMTSMTTLLVLIALFVFGGEIIHGFAFALIIGIVVGTYSSIYVASTAVLMLGISKADLMPVAKEGGQVDAEP